MIKKSMRGKSACLRLKFEGSHEVDLVIFRSKQGDE